MPIDLYDSAFLADPYPTYERLRSEQPVAQVPGTNVWLLSRHDDVSDALRNPAVFSSAQGVAFHDGAGDSSLVGTDDPDHTRLRRLLSKQFTPRSVAALEGDVRAEVARAVATLDQASGSVDVAATLAAELPTRVIATYMGIDPDDWRTYKLWSDLVNEIIWSGSPDMDLVTRATEAGAESTAFFTDQIAQRRAVPREDLIGRLVAAADTSDALTDHEIVQFCFLLMLAGNVTTTSVLSHAVLLLLQHPEQRALLEREPERIPAAVEEVVRYEAPVQGFLRTLTQDIEMHGTTLRTGDKTMLLFGSAGRDSSLFVDAHTFDVTRDTSAQVSFGGGPHFCLGSWLARLEAKVLLEELVPRMAHWQLDPDRPVVRVPSPAFREISSLHVLKDAGC